MALINFLQHVGENAGKGITSFPMHPSGTLPIKPVAVDTPTSREVTHTLAPVEEAPPKSSHAPLPPPPSKDIPPPRNSSKGEFEVNLIPTNDRSEVKGNKVWYRLIITFIISWLVIEGITFAVNAKARSQEKSVVGLTQEIDDINTQIKDYTVQSKSMAPFSKRLQYVATLLDQHVYWSKIWPVLESRTVPDVYFVRVAGDAQGALIVDAIGKDLVSVAQQIVALRDDPMVRSANVTGITFNRLVEKIDAHTNRESVKSVGFSIAITLTKDALSKSLRVTTTK